MIFLIFFGGGVEKEEGCKGRALPAGQGGSCVLMKGQKAAMGGRETRPGRPRPRAPGIDPLCVWSRAGLPAVPGVIAPDGEPGGRCKAGFYFSGSFSSLSLLALNFSGGC